MIGGSGYSNAGEYTSSSTIYSTLNDFRENGGGILSTSWFNFETRGYYNNPYLSAITPFVHNGTYQYGTPGTITIVQSNNEVTNGISNFYPTCSHTEYATSIDSGAEKLGGLSGVDNANTIIVHDHGSNGRTGYLGGLYMGATQYGVSNMRSGVEDQLLEQMVYWLAGGGHTHQNNPPVASSFVSGSVEDVSSTIDLVSQDADNDPVSYTILDGPFHGELVFSSDASVLYSPYNNFFGLDSFTYVAYDGTDYSEPATITIDVSEVNDKPVAMDDHFMIAEDDTLRGNLIAEGGYGCIYYPSLNEYGEEEDTLSLIHI